MQRENSCGCLGSAELVQDMTKVLKTATVGHCINIYIIIYYIDCNITNKRCYKIKTYFQEL